MSCHSPNEPKKNKSIRLYLIVLERDLNQCSLWLAVHDKMELENTHSENKIINGFGKYKYETKLLFLVYLLSI